MLSSTHKKVSLQYMSLLTKLIGSLYKLIFWRRGFQLQNKFDDIHLGILIAQNRINTSIILIVPLQTYTRRNKHSQNLQQVQDSEHLLGNTNASPLLLIYVISFNIYISFHKFSPSHKAFLTNININLFFIP